MGKANVRCAQANTVPLTMTAEEEAVWRAMADKRNGGAIGDCWNAIDALADELDATRELVAERSKDRERMDWLARHITNIDWLALQNHDNIRAVIDAARAADGSGG